MLALSLPSRCAPCRCEPRVKAQRVVCVFVSEGVCVVEPQLCVAGGTCRTSAAAAPPPLTPPYHSPRASFTRAGTRLPLALIFSPTPSQPLFIFLSALRVSLSVSGLFVVLLYAAFSFLSFYARVCIRHGPFHSVMLFNEYTVSTVHTSYPLHMKTGPVCLSNSLSK